MLVRELARLMPDRQIDTAVKLLPTAPQESAIGSILDQRVFDSAGTEFCQSALEWDPLSAYKRDPFDRRALLVALASSELVGVAETARARVV